MFLNRFPDQYIKINICVKRQQAKEAVVMLRVLDFNLLISTGQYVSGLYIPSMKGTP
jgi:hypothetical protein